MHWAKTCKPNCDKKHATLLAEMSRLLAQNPSNLVEIESCRTQLWDEYKEDREAYFQAFPRSQYKDMKH